MGEVKTVDATQKDPRSTTGAFQIYVAYEMGEELFGYANRKKDEAALEDVRRGIDPIETALRQMSMHTRHKIGTSSYEQISGVVEAPVVAILPAVLQALRAGTTAAFDSVVEKGTPTSRQIGELPPLSTPAEGSFLRAQVGRLQCGLATALRRQAMLEACCEKAGAFVHQQIIWVKDSASAASFFHRLMNGLT